MGAVVVPAYRALGGGRQPGLDLAARLATHYCCALVVLCSGAARTADIPASLRWRLGENLIVLERSSVEYAHLPSLKSARSSLCTLWRSNDAAIKRNLGLALAIRAGWSHVLFVDDDISPCDVGDTLDEVGLEKALAAMGADSCIRAVGWTAEDFPDNSVVGHARRLVDRPQQVFISSAALLVRCDVDVPFFPGVYNEDWFFLIATAAASPRYQECLAWAGRVRQLQYEPYSATRAMSEEPGDILGEGLMNLLEDDGPALWSTGSTNAYWRKAMSRRAALIREILAELGDDTTRAVADDRRLPARTALRAALRVHGDVKPAALRNYVNEWRGDLWTWSRYLTRLAESAERVVPPASASPRRAVARADRRGEPQGGRPEVGLPEGADGASTRRRLPKGGQGPRGEPPTAKKDATSHSFAAESTLTT